jgi:hypothetical protein
MESGRRASLRAHGEHAIGADESNELIVGNAADRRRGHQAGGRRFLGPGSGAVYFVPFLRHLALGLLVLGRRRDIVDHSNESDGATPCALPLDRPVECCVGGRRPVPGDNPLVVHVSLPRKLTDAY